ncbi:MAG TPA: efflux RND transporter periplasmic adaptor subunit [Chitinophagaceae bacterium]|nr:efflux RND transporter periplasmic adaptor subunit [Chitinophagaceae bacterium]
MKRSGWIALLIIITSCGGHETQVAITTANAVDTVPVFILHDTAVSKIIELPAELLPLEQANIAARVQGYIKEVKVDIGDKVHQGETLAVIEAPELQTKYEEYEASLQAAKAKYMSSADAYSRMNKAARASSAGIVAPVDLERSRNQYLADSASYEASRRLAQSYKEVAGYLVIKAPFDGVVTARNVDRGAIVGNNQTLLTLQNIQTLRLRVAVPELYIAAGDLHKETAFRVDAYPEKLFTAVLTRKSNSIDATTRTEIWEYRYKNNSGQLKAGEFAYVKLNLQRTGNSFIVPPTAIATTQERKFVIKVYKGKAEWVDIRQGLSTDRGIEIFGNLANNDTLVMLATDERKPGNSAYWKLAK